MAKISANIFSSANIMSRRKNKKQRNRGKGYSDMMGNPSQVALRYNGPVIVPGEREEAHTIATLQSETAFISSSVGGAITTVFAASPTGSVDWGNISAAWHEYRVIGMRVEFFPNNRYSKTTTTCRPLIAVSDRSSGGVLASYSAAIAHESAKKKSLEDPWIMEVKMIGVEDSVWTATATSYSAFWIKLYADGLTASTEYGMYVVYRRIQFRGRL